MAAITFYPLNETCDGGATLFLEMQRDGSAPSTVVGSTRWIVASVAADRYANMRAMASVSSFSSTAAPSGGPDDTDAVRNAMRSEATLNGSFASNNWTFTFDLIASSAFNEESTGAIRITLWKGAAADGSDATEFMTVQQGSTVTSLQSESSQQSTITANPGAVTFTDEYLFIRVAFRVTTQYIFGITNDVAFYHGSGFTIVTSDFTAASVTYSRSLSESLAATDSAQRRADLYRTASETTRLSDTPTRACLYGRNPSESCGVRDSFLFRVANASRTVSESHALTDNATRQAYLSRTVSESQALTDNVQRRADLYRTVSESLGVQDQFLFRVVLVQRSLNESLAATDSMTRQAFYYRAVTDFAALVDVFVDRDVVSPDPVTHTIMLAESMAMYDAASRSVLALRTLAESLAATDSPDRRVDYARQLSEAVAVQELLGRAVTALRQLSESMGIYDAATLEQIEFALERFSDEFYRPHQNDEAV